MPAQFVYTKNPANGNIGRVPKRLFDDQLKDKGFTLVDDGEGVLAAGRDPSVLAKNQDETEPAAETETEVKAEAAPEDTSTRRSTFGKKDRDEE